jgi:hypothetical protein
VPLQATRTNFFELPKSFQLKLPQYALCKKQKKKKKKKKKQKNKNNNKNKIKKKHKNKKKE